MIKRFRYIDITDNKIDLACKKVIIWGISISGLYAMRDLLIRNANVLGFTDSFVTMTGYKFAEYPVYRYDELQKMENIYIYISTSKIEYQREILKKTDGLFNAVILAKGFVYGPGEYDNERMKKIIDDDKDQIERVYNSLEDERSRYVFNKLLEYRKSNNEELLRGLNEKTHSQYFPIGELFVLGKDEVFIDAGGYDGNTSYEFYCMTNGVYKNIYIMEPDTIMRRITYANIVQIKRLPNVIVVGKGAYSYTSSGISFNNDEQTGSSTICDEGTSTVETITIDDMLEGNNATFIKMDIEGAEREALEGCKKTIEMYHPKLALSIYHKEDDLWKIPYIIADKYPFYKLYIRHYTDITNETVLYAVP